MIDYCDCNIDYSDRPEFYSEVVRKARKQYVCTECGGPISRGELYMRHAGKWDGQMAVYCECPACMELREWATISLPCFCAYEFGTLHDRVRAMVSDVRRIVPGFVFEWGRRMIRIERRRSGEHWPRKGRARRL